MDGDNSVSAIIFDCDGVLVDSEMLSAGVLMQMMEEIGLPITEEIFRRDFLGRSFAAAAERAGKRFGRPLPDDFPLGYRTRLLHRMTTELRPMEGVLDLLPKLRVPFCVATSSSPERLALSLRVTGLAAFFRGRAVTASEVARGKPAPDLCFHAARRIGVDPSRCLVIDDSEMGLRCARAARMKVWHFIGGAHMKAGYRPPADVTADRTVSSMADLREIFAGMGLC